MENAFVRYQRTRKKGDDEYPCSIWAFSGLSIPQPLFQRVFLYQRLTCYNIQGSLYLEQEQSLQLKSKLKLKLSSGIVDRANYSSERENHRARGEANREERREAGLTFHARGGVHELPRISHSLRISIFKQGHSVLSNSWASNKGENKENN